MTKLISLLLALLTAFLPISSGRDHSFPGVSKASRSIVRAIRHHNSDALIDMMSEEFKTAYPDISGRVDEWIDLIDGFVISYSSSESKETLKNDGYGNIYQASFWTITLKTTKETYLIDAGWIGRNTDDPRQEGMCTLNLYTEGNECLLLLQRNGLLSVLEPEYEGESVAFGSYPQSQETDPATLAALNALPLDWQSYRYYCGDGEFGHMQPEDFMWFADVDYQGQKYRAVRIDAYRPGGTEYALNSKYQDLESFIQADNGYYVGIVYWFRFEPLIWRVLDREAGLVLCETIIDAQPFNNYIAYAEDESGQKDYSIRYGDEAHTYYSNNYVKSSIRTWLNQLFYAAAFSSEEGDAIQVAAIQNLSYNTPADFLNGLGVDYEDTADPVFLLSSSDVINPQYGFDPRLPPRAIGSDYAQCQGLYVPNHSKKTELSYGYYSKWYLRTPFDEDRDGLFGSRGNTICVVELGRINYSQGTSAILGIRPAMYLKNVDAWLVNAES